MAESIYIEADEIWGYFEEYSKELEVAMHLVAENKEYGTCVYLTCSHGEKEVVVEADDVEVYRENILSENDASTSVAKVYDDYLTSKALKNLSSGEFRIFKKDDKEDDVDDEDIKDIKNADDEHSALEIEFMIEDREAELNDIFYDLIASTLGSGMPYYSGDISEDMVEDVKDHVLEYLARKHNVKIYRPMILEDESGDEFFEEYPYECMEFEDEDNPLYKAG